jgi:glycosyltransferase involved in cell wall biosynthesis
MEQDSQTLVSFIIPTLNEERCIARCLDSVLRQQVDNVAVEILVADAHSTDQTRKIVAAYGERTGHSVTLLDNPDGIAEFGKARALARARGQYIVLLDADNEIVQDDWLSTLLEAFQVFPEIVAVESHYLPVPGETALNHYLTSCLHISDPLAHGIASRPRALGKTCHRGATYRQFSLPAGYPTGANGFIYRRSCIESFVGAHTFEEAHVIVQLALSGAASFAMVDGYGVRHDYADSFGKFLRKRRKIALKHTTRASERTSWVAHTGWRRFVMPLAYATGVVPCLTSVVAAVRDRNLHWLLHGPVCFVTAWVYAYSAVSIRIRGKRAW